MRALLSSFFPLILTCASVAQNGSQDAQATASLTSPQIQDQSSVDPQNPVQPTVLYTSPRERYLTCFFIRSYNFERRGTEAPKLKNMTTCTPAKSDQFRQTDKKPQVRLIPAN
jgi:hypothetical protein